jgi:hypothetical protein
LTERRKTMVIRRSREAKAAIQGGASREETLALLKILALGNQQVARGKVKGVAHVVRRLRERSSAD